MGFIVIKYSCPMQWDTHSVNSNLNIEISILQGKFKFVHVSARLGQCKTCITDYECNLPLL